MRQTKNALYPLFWQHGEKEEELREEIGKMQEGGIGGFIVESRPHPDYLSYGWWRDLEVILSEAAKRQMEVWIFDDGAYPSGLGGGKVKALYPEACKRYIAKRQIDAVGPMPGASFQIAPWLEEGEELYRVIAARRAGGREELHEDSFVDLTGTVKDGRLHWDVPTGQWRVFLLIITRNGGEEWTKDYVNPISYEAVGRFIDIVYEEHYRRFGEQFGKTIKGFFVDEPRFGSTATYERTLGKEGHVYPWSEEVPELLEAELGERWACLLPLLWSRENPICRDVQYAYMNVVSRLFARDFTGQIREWCGRHGVKVIGHVVEDNGVHARIGYGPGHYFRSMEGFDAAGLDVVYQVWPERRDGFFTSPFGYLDAEFFYWGISKMASSAAHIDPSKKGITMCEIFGAYGWQEGLKLMKWLTDHVCVRGVNMLVPHAFSPKYPDPDCPPHFYAKGKNPQWRYFRKWADYANRVCTLLRDGTHRATAAVLYHAEAEWGGGYQPFEKVVRALAEAQIDCDVVPADCLEGILEAGAGSGRIYQVKVEDGRLRVNREAYRAILIPYAECLPEKLLEALDLAARAGVPVLFMDGYPEHVYYAAGPHAVQRALEENPLVETCGLAQAAEWMKAHGLTDIRVRDCCPDLRFLHYEREEGDIYFFTNESKWNTVDTGIVLREDGRLAFYDAMEDVRYPLMEERIGADVDGMAGEVSFRMVLEPYQSVFVVPEDAGEEGTFAEAGDSSQCGARTGMGACTGAVASVGTVAYTGTGASAETAACGRTAVPMESKALNGAEMSGKPGERPMPVIDREFLAVREQKRLDGAWRISVLRENGEYEALEGLTELTDISAEDILPVYSGRIRYEISFELEQGEAGDGREAVLDLGQVYEISDVELNGGSVGCRICPPHLYRLECRPGRNELRVTVTNTSAKEKMGNVFDRAMPQEPSGLLGPVRLYLCAKGQTAPEPCRPEPEYGKMSLHMKGADCQGN